MRIVNELALGGAVFAFSAISTAAQLSIPFSTDLQFTPGLQVAAGGTTAGDVLGELFGANFGESGNVPVTGSLTYDSDTPQFEASGNGRAWQDPITAVTLKIAGVDVVSQVGAFSVGDGAGLFVGSNGGGFCLNTSAAACGQFNVVPSESVNGAVAGNDSEVVVQGPDGEFEFSQRDSLIFGLGFTEVNGEFSPTFETDVVGPISVDGILLTVLGQPGENMFDEPSLPSERSFLANSESYVVSIFFDGENLDTGFGGNGVGEVPLPTPILLLTSAIATLWLRRKTRSA